MNKMNFGQAIEALKEGKKVAREGWNGKGMYLALKMGHVSWNSEELALFQECVKPCDKIEGVNAIVEHHASICIKTVDNKILTGWYASKTDILSEDWVIVE
jgi:hypothetical protein